jgi:hypothetical protein
MTKPEALNLWKAFLCLALVGVVLMLNGCTLVRYTDGQKSLTIADIRISGSAIDLKATVDGIGSLDVNREQGSAGEAVTEVIGVLP